MIRTMEEAENSAIIRVADQMVAAARTAPKGSGKDKVVSMIVTGEDKDRLSEKMHELAKDYNEQFIERDACNVENSVAVVLIGVHSAPFGLTNCSMCGFPGCRDTVNAGANCAFNITDLGIAIGSAVSVAADHRIDNRVMYSVGRGAIKAGFMPHDVRVCFGIPLFTGSKSIYFDRGPGAVLR